MVDFEECKEKGRVTWDPEESISTIGQVFFVQYFLKGAAFTVLRTTRAYRLKMAAFLRTFIHDGFRLSLLRVGVRAHPLFTLSAPLHSSYVSPTAPSTARKKERKKERSYYFPNNSNR
jgi:hypothetical protein